MVLVFSTEGRSDELADFFFYLDKDVAPGVLVTKEGEPDPCGPWALVFERTAAGDPNYIQAIQTKAREFLNTFSGMDDERHEHPVVSVVDFDELLGDYE